MTRLIDAEALRVAVRTLLNDRASGATDETVFDVITNAPILHAEQWAGRDEFVMSEYANKEDLYKAMREKIADQAATIAQLEEQLKDREGDLKFEYNERINQEGIALRASYKYVEYCDIAEEKIAQLELDNARMREKMHMAKIQCSRADCNLILNEALATQPTEYNPFINEDK